MVEVRATPVRSASSICVVHLTTVHPPLDVRIFQKEARTLARNGYDVALIAPHAEEGAREGVRLTPVARPEHRLGRMTLGPLRAVRQVRRLRPDIVHIHDPELLLLGGWLLTRAGYAVVYDAHEDTPAQVLDKEWIPRPLRSVVSWGVDRFERRAARRLAAVIAATETIAARFPGAVVVHNYPDLARFPTEETRAVDDHIRAVYVGGLVRARGARAMVEAIGAVRSKEVTLDVIGAIEPATLREELELLPGYDRVQAHGQKSWVDSWRYVCRHADIGLLLYQPARNHTEALPTKLFEYMAAGIPVIASDFPLWRGILESSGAGIVVDPRDSKAIAAAIDRVAADPELRRDMGGRGREAVIQRYNWAKEADVLLEVYRRVLGAHR